MEKSLIDLYIDLAENKLGMYIWRELFTKQLLLWKFNDESINTLFEWGSSGHNWSKLHPDHEEELKTMNEREKTFKAELEYCSDRMSLDRLFRCHWLYNQWRISKND